MAEKKNNRYGMKKLRHCHPMYTIIISPLNVASRDESIIWTAWAVQWGVSLRLCCEVLQGPWQKWFVSDHE